MGTLGGVYLSFDIVFVRVAPDRRFAKGAGLYGSWALSGDPAF